MKLLLFKPQNRIILLLSVVTLAVLWDVYPLPDNSARLKNLPLQGFRYRMRDVPLTATEKETFGQATVVKRLVRCAGQPPILLTIIDGSKNRHAVHDPTYCLRGAGWEILTQQPLPLPNGIASWLRLRQRTADGTQETEAVYWYANGKSCYTSPVSMWKDRTLRRLTFGRFGAEPVEILLQEIDPDAAPDWNTIAEILKPLWQ